MPTPQDGETQDEFIERCIPIVIEDGTAEDNEQATAVCYSMWENRDKGAEDDMSKAQQPKEHKTLPFIWTKIDEDQGIVEHTVAVMGNVDLGGDRIHPGAFTKTISERAGKIRVLDAHNSMSVLNVIGKPLSLWEAGRDELPAKVRAAYPDATGALMARTQFLMDTPEGKGAFTRIRDGAVDEYSIGYDPITAEYSDEERDGKTVSVRNLKEIRLWEYSPVAFAMNPATSTLSAKADEQATSTDPEPDPPRYVGAEDEPETKVGRAISAANATRIRSAIDAAQQAFQDLEALLESTMPATDEPDEQETDEQDQEKDREGDAGPGDDPPTSPPVETADEKDAGPPQAPTSEITEADIDEWMRDIQRQLSEVNSG